MIRLFVESVLRYGLPPGFVAGVIQPKQKAEKKLRALLEGFGDAGSVSCIFSAQITSSAARQIT